MRLYLCLKVECGRHVGVVELDHHTFANFFRQLNAEWVLTRTFKRYFWRKVGDGKADIDNLFSESGHGWLVGLLAKLGISAH